MAIREEGGGYAPPKSSEPEAQRPDRPAIPEPPLGWGQLAWLGPGFLWMVSATGSGELLFTPRVGSLYGYTLVWALIAAVALKWFINREVGRFTTCTGATILNGFTRLPGPRNWALWLILVPQTVVAIATIAGLAAAAATALVLVLPGPIWLWTVGLIVAAAGLVIWGRYRGVEFVARSVAVVLAVASVVAAISVVPPVDEIAAGLVPRLPEGIDYTEILPWLGFMLSGAAGMIWYSYWLKAKGYGAASHGRETGPEGDRVPEEEPVDPSQLGERDLGRLRGWLKQLTLDNSVAVGGTLVITMAFLILGAQLLRPRGLVPEEDRVAETLGLLLGGIWGPVGFWFMIVAVGVGFWNTVLSDQDGFSRMFADGTRHLARSFHLRGRWADYEFLKVAFVVVLVTILPIALYLVMGEPVGLLKIAGAIEAAHIPVLTGLTLYLNHRVLPPGLRPSWPVFVLTALAGLFFAVFAVFYLFTSF